MRTRLNGPSAIVLALCAIVALPSSVRAEGDEKGFEQSIPADAIAFVTVRDISRFKKRFKTTPIWKLWEEDEVQAFLEKALTKMKEGLDEVQKEIGVSPFDLVDLFQGEASMVVLRVTEDDGDPTEQAVKTAVIADIGDGKEKVEEKINTLLEKAMEKEGADAIRRIEEERDGVTIIRLVREIEQAEDENDGGGDEQVIVDEEGNEIIIPQGGGGGDAMEPETREIAYAFAGQGIIISDSKEAVGAMAASLNEAPEENLSSNESYSRCMNAVRNSDSEVYGFLDLGGIIKLSVAEQKKQHEANPAAAAAAPKLEDVYTALGFDEIQGVSLSLGWDEKGWMSKWFLHSEGEKRGILRLLSPEGENATVPRIVPRDSTEWLVWNFRGDEIWTEVEKIVATMVPQMQMMFNMFVVQGFTNRFGLNIKDDIFGTVKGNLTTYTRIGEPFNARSRRNILLLELSSTEKFKALFGKIAEGDEWTTEEYLGYTITRLDTGGGAEMGGMDDGEDEAQANVRPAPAIAFVGERLVFGQSAGDVKDFIRRQGKAAEENVVASADLTKALARLPENRTALSYFDSRRTLRWLHTMLTDEKARGELDFMAANFVRQIGETVDLDKTPKLDVLLKYATFTVSALSSTDDGFVAVTYSPFELSKDADEGEEAGEE